MASDVLQKHFSSSAAQQWFPQSTVFALLTRMLREQKQGQGDFYADVFLSLSRMADHASSVRTSRLRFLMQ